MLVKQWSRKIKTPKACEATRIETQTGVRKQSSGTANATPDSDNANSVSRFLHVRPKNKLARQENAARAAKHPFMYRVGILTVSDRCYAGKRDDASGPAIADCLPVSDYEVVFRGVVPDDEGEIANQLLAMCDGGCQLILTTGGTGFAPRDVTPEATVSILDKNAPGIAELLRADGLRSVPTAALGRGVAGIYGETFIVNLPGSPGAARDGIRTLLPLLPHALALLCDEAAGHE